MKGAEREPVTGGKADAAQERSEGTRSFVRRVRAATRRRYTPEEQIRIVLEGFRREVTVSDLCLRALGADSPLGQERVGG